MKPLTIKDFNGGMVDEYHDCQPRFCQRMQNMMLDAGGKPYSRNGTVKWGPQISTSEAITGLRVFKNITNRQNLSQHTAFAYSHRKIFASTADVNETTPPTVWNEVTSVYSGNYSIAQNVSVLTRCKMQALNNHVYLCFQNTDNYSDPNFHPRPRALFPDATDVWISRNVGMPAYTSTPTFSGSGSGGNYLYYFVYKLQYSVNGVAYAFFGTPSPPFAISTAVIDGSHAVSISALTYPDPTAFHDLYAIGGLWTIEIYRTQNNQSVAQHLHTEVYNSSTYSDVTVDAALGASLYTADGTQGYDEPPPCKLYHVVGDFGYFGGFDINSSVFAPVFPTGFMGAIQSAPGVVESAPGANTIATPDHLTAIESVDYYPIFFTRNGCFRVEGQIDSYGAGTPVLRTISEKVGALHQQLVWKMDRGLGFCSVDGIYFTDGFSVKKLSGHINKYYRQWFNNLTPSYIQGGSSTYIESTKKFFISASLLSVPQVGGNANTVQVGDLTHQTDEGGSAISYLVGSASVSTFGYSYLPTALEVFQNTLLMGDALGYVQAMNLEPSNASEFMTQDVGVDVSADPSTWISVPVVWDWVSPVLDFGSRFLKKWVARAIVTFKIRYSQSAIYAKIMSINDDSLRFATNGVETSDSQPFNLVQDINIPASKFIWPVLRRIPKAHLRCLLKQIRIQKSFAVLLSSNPLGVRAYPVGTLNQSAKTFFLTASGTFPTPSQFLGQQLFFSGNYSQGFVISAASSTTLTVLDPGSVLPASGNYDWEVMGYAKDQGIALDSVTLFYDTLIPGTENNFSASQTGNNP